MAVLGSLPLRAGDEVLITSHTYAAVAKQARHLAARAGAIVVEAALPFPTEDASQLVAAVARALTPRTRLAVLDHVTSPTALVMPLAPLIAACRATGARVLIDGAHAPGMLPLDIPRLGADWYAGNAHKWLCAAKGCGFLWARREAQAGLHPAVISHGYGEGFLAEFDWTGTRDLSPFLSIGAALEFRDRHGDARIMAHNRALADAAARHLGERWGTRIGMPPALAGAMTMVALPRHFAGDQAAAIALRRRLWDEARIDVPILVHGGAFWARLSAQIYNTMDDYDRLAAAIEAMSGRP
jgi:isopenicillin-N epimerase